METGMSDTDDSWDDDCLTKHAVLERARIAAEWAHFLAAAETIVHLSATAASPPHSHRPSFPRRSIGQDSSRAPRATLVLAHRVRR